jgi:hypothetical protein
MNTRKTVYNKLFAEKVELSAYEVQLGLLQDIEKELVTANAGAIKAIDLANAAKKPAETSLKANKDLLVKFQNFVTQMKELGILSPQKEVENGITRVKENIKAIENLIGNLSKI